MNPDLKTSIDPDPNTQETNPGIRFLVRHLLYGSGLGIDRTIKILHAYGYATIPGATPSPCRPVLSKTLLLQ